MTIISGSITNRSDSIVADDANDLISALRGDDTVLGGGGRDLLSGNAGNDSLDGEEGNDILYGGDNGDALYGGNGNDQLNGDAGDDILYGDLGNDLVNGGDGSDIYAGDYSTASSGLTMTYDPTTGNGTITAGTETDTFTSIESFSNFVGTAFDDVILGGSGNNTGIYGGAGNDTITGGNAVNTLYGDAGNDTLNGGSSVDYLQGGDGDDTLNGNAYYDYLYSDRGNDILNGGSELDIYAADYSSALGPLIMTYDPTTGNGTIVAGSEIDTLISIETFSNMVGTEYDDIMIGGSPGVYYYSDQFYGYGGNDTIQGNGADDLLNGMEGNDTLSGGADRDSLFGGNGNDLLNGDAGDDSLSGDPGNDILDGGDGSDVYVADYSFATSGLTMTYDATTGSGVIAAGGETDTLSSIESFANFFGTEFDDQIIGSTSTDGGLYGQGGNDTILGYGGNDSLYGGDGNDLVSGGSGRNDLYGGNGNDYLKGNDGDDTLNGDRGSDTLDGGNGFDSYVADYSFATTALVMTYDSTTLSGSITVDGETDTLISIDSFYYLVGTTFDETILGTENDDGEYAFGAGVYGNGGNDTILGNGGGDTLYGGDGDDTLIGGSGYDSMRGEAGNDTIDARDDGGGDNLYGGLGDDIYYIDNSGEYLYDEGGFDQVYAIATYTLPGAIGSNGVENLTLTGSEAINGTGDDLSNTLTGNSASNLLNGKNGADSLSGNNGSDTLMGGGGADTLTGGGGSDFFQFNAASERTDTITDFASVPDTLQVQASGFGGGLTAGTLNASQFVLGDQAVDSGDRFIYDQSTGSLFFDSDGTGSSTQLKIALFTNAVALAASDIVIF